MSRQRSFILLILALVFSQFIIINYNLWDGFEFHGIKIRTGSFLQLKFQNSEFKTLTTAVIGYFLFAIYLFNNLKNKDARASRLFEPTFIITILAIIFELRNIYLDIISEYSGQRVTIGIILFILCFKIFLTSGKENNETIIPTVK
jgi:hypothetical protein